MRERVARADAVRPVRRWAASALSPTGLRGAAVEVGWVAAHAALYPLGVVAERARHGDIGRKTLGGLSPLQRGLVIGDVEAAGTPILLVHGMVDNRSIFTVLRRSLRRRGFHRVITLNYSPLTRDVRLAATGLATRVEQLCEETGFERIHVIGHSMGGLIARYYVQRLGGDARVHTLVTLGTPHGGTRAAQLVPHRLARQLCPDSALIRELAEPAPGCRTRMLAVWSDLDQLMVPKRNARLAHPDLESRNLLVRGVGHMSLPIHRHTVHEITLMLAQLDPAGSTVTPGVTPISTSAGGSGAQTGSARGSRGAEGSPGRASG
ncbi:MAG TPA: alpha/beta fold hydrolase [Actinomycetes bacterium]|nr:alpha/beta fold hydrolase [Actinomycetes bacterium]